ncbi:hypothetical protein SAMN02745121_05342 [Nannocystis exedens]|uniref:Uncharacterized protein n=1 Tax=Nannocystis exedens TaxID=54 RepID=A0A1I2CYL2_9BACT|nr:hypothetical protein [Nannocystis exedens]PCC68666.1 ribulose-phosphate 3-epimerase [Nannocystis exedens]SFE73407.1 hypothetical protein SAMN02745121_05342 [Nannocystis exedens]
MKPCTRCERHVRVSEVVCPFCGATQHEVSATVRTWAVGLAMLGAACGPAKEDSASGSGSEATSEATTSTEPTTTTAPTSSGSDSEAGTGTSTSTSTSTDTGGTASSTECASCSDSTEGGAFIYAAPDMGGGGIKECDPWVQDCPIGQKCVPFSGDGDTSPESLHCAPVAESPEQAGDPCVVQGSGTDQTDNCDVGLFCWLDSCVPLCTGTPDAPACADPANGCTIANDGVLTLCLPKCDPLTQNCEADEVCLNTGETQEFVCVPDASGDGGQEFDPCTFQNSCDPGLICLDPALATECEAQASGCCLKFCDLTMPTCTGAGAECMPWFEGGMAPAELEDVGVCKLPE